MVTTPASARNRQMSLVAGGMFLTGGLVSGMISQLPYDGPGWRSGWQLALAAFAALTGAGLLATAGRIPAWQFHPILIVGTAIISVGAWLSNDLAASNAMFFAWSGAFIYTFFTWHQALAYTAYAGAAYALVLANSADPIAPLSRWIYVVTTIISTGMVFRWLVAQLERARRDLADLNQHLESRVADQVAEIGSYAKDLRDSRARLVTTQDAERRRLERDLHDGAQQQIVALKIYLRLTKSLLSDGDIDEAKTMLDTLVTDVDEAVQSLRELAHGIYPPLLAAEGLGPALAARAERSDMTVDVIDRGLGRCSAEIEAAVYFCCLEALQNITKYAQATAVIVTLGRADGSLTFSVRDDGVGFDPDSVPRGHGLMNLQDRLDALSGTLVIDSSSGAGTIVEGRVPLPEDNVVDASR